MADKKYSYRIIDEEPEKDYSYRIVDEESAAQDTSTPVPPEEQRPTFEISSSEESTPDMSKVVKLTETIDQPPTSGLSPESTPVTPEPTTEELKDEEKKNYFSVTEFASPDYPWQKKLLAATSGPFGMASLAKGVPKEQLPGWGESTPENILATTNLVLSPMVELTRGLWRGASFFMDALDATAYTTSKMLPGWYYPKENIFSTTSDIAENIAENIPKTVLHPAVSGLANFIGATPGVLAGFAPSGAAAEVGVASLNRMATGIIQRKLLDKSWRQGAVNILNFSINEAMKDFKDSDGSKRKALEGALFGLFEGVIFEVAFRSVAGGISAAGDAISGALARHYLKKAWLRIKDATGDAELATRIVRILKKLLDNKSSLRKIKLKAVQEARKDWEVEKKRLQVRQKQERVERASQIREQRRVLNATIQDDVKRMTASIENALKDYEKGGIHEKNIIQREEEIGKALEKVINDLQERLDVVYQDALSYLLNRKDEIGKILGKKKQELVKINPVVGLPIAKVRGTFYNQLKEASENLNFPYKKNKAGVWVDEATGKPDAEFNAIVSVFKQRMTDGTADLRYLTNLAVRLDNIASKYYSAPGASNKAAGKVFEDFSEAMRPERLANELDFRPGELLKELGDAYAAYSAERTEIDFALSVFFTKSEQGWATKAVELQKALARNDRNAIRNMQRADDYLPVEHQLGKSTADTTKFQADISVRMKKYIIETKEQMLQSKKELQEQYDNVLEQAKKYAEEKKYILAEKIRKDAYDFWVKQDSTITQAINKLDDTLQEIEDLNRLQGSLATGTKAMIQRGAFWSIPLALGTLTWNPALGTAQIVGSAYLWNKYRPKVALANAEKDIRLANALSKLSGPTNKLKTAIESVVYPAPVKAIGKRIEETQGPNIGSSKGSVPIGGTPKKAQGKVELKKKGR